MIIHGDNDEVVPFRNSLKLIDALGCELVLFDDNERFKVMKDAKVTLI